MPSLGLGLNLYKTQTAVYSGLKLDAQAVAHYDRVIADGGIIPAGLLGCNAWFVAVKAVYGVTDITTAISAGYDPHYLGAKIGAGSGPTLGQAATKLYSCSGASGDLTQATAASMPLLLVKNSSDANYAWFPKVVGNYINSTTTYLTNDIDIEFSVNVPATQSGTQQVIGTNTTSPFSILINRATETIFLEYESGGYKSCNAPFTPALTNVIRVTRNSTTGAVTFINNGVTLTTSGTQAAGALDATISSLCVGGYTGGYAFIGRVNYVNCYISGVLNKSFNPASYNAATSQTQWTSTTGEVWTINKSNSTTGFCGQLVDKTRIYGDALNKGLYNASITINQPDTIYTAFSVETTTASGFIYDGNSTRQLFASIGGNTNYFIGADPTTLITSGQTKPNTLRTFSTIMNGASSSYAFDSNSDTNISVGTAGFNGLSLIYSEPNGIGSPYTLKGALSTFIISNSANSSLIKTAMNNYVKSSNNL